MCVRLSELPIEYYDAKVLYVVGDKIGRIVRVDKNIFFSRKG